MSSTARGNHNTPGIYDREKQIVTTPAPTIGSTSLGLVGETLMGPAFQPIEISSYREFQTYFGGCSPEKYSNGYPRYELPYIAKSYLSESNQLYVTRVLGLSGYEMKGAWFLGLKNGNDNTNSIFATIRSKCIYTSANTLESIVTGLTMSNLISISGITDTFTITAALSGGTSESYTVSLKKDNKNNILKVIGKGYNAIKKNNIFVEEYFEGVVNNAMVQDNTFYPNTTISATTVPNGFYNDYRGTYAPAISPWFVSEVKGNKIIPLFRFITITDGNAANNLFKVSVRNIDKEKLTFDIVIRAINDTDAKPNIIESFSNCTLDPTDGNNYLGAKIGTIDELYINKSKYVVVEISDDGDVEQSIPMGFEGYKVKTTELFPDKSKLTYNTTVSNIGTNASKKPYCGLSDTTKIDYDFFTYKGESSYLSLTNGFHMESAAAGITDYTNGEFGCLFTTLDSTNEAIVNNDKALKKFTAYFAGGFDGWDIWRDGRTNTNDFSYNKFLANFPNVEDSVEPFTTCDGDKFEYYFGTPNIPAAKGMTSDYYAWWSAIRTFADPESVDINLLATTGIDWYNNDMLVSEVIDMLETDRKDTLYLLTSPDKESGKTDTKQDMINASVIVSELDSKWFDTNYAATFYPWCQYYDNENGAYVYLPATRDILANIAYTDKTSYSWFPPAGFGRGTINCVKAKKSLTLAEEDILCNGRINIIKTFAKEGVKAWSQRTLQIEEGPLNRIGVRRMMLDLRKVVRRSNLPLIFEPNDNTTKNKFLEIVNPILKTVKTNRGISDSYIEIDDSVEAKLRHEMNVKIFVKPISALEFINLDFMITDEGFDFSEFK